MRFGGPPPPPTDEEIRQGALGARRHTIVFLATVAVLRMGTGVQDEA